MDILSILYNVAAFVVAIGVLVTIHEFGHFWVARRMGVKVLRFSVGFGKPLLTKKLAGDDTEYVLAAIPLGGYVKMLDEREGPVDDAELDQAFNRKSVGRRFAIVAAGPVFNFLFAIVAYYLIFVVGVAGIKPVIGEVKNPSPAHSAGIVKNDRILSINGIETVSWEKVRFTLLDQAVGQSELVLQVQGEDLQVREKVIDIGDLQLLQDERIDLMGDLGLSTWRPEIAPVIDAVIEGGAAEAAGVQVDDVIESLNGIKITNARQWVDLIRGNDGNTLDLRVIRNNESLGLKITPRTREQDGEVYGFIGVQNRIEIPDKIRREMSVVERYGLFAAVGASVEKTWKMSWLTLRVLGKLVIGEASVKNLSGPITIAHYAGITARIGLEQFLGFLAIISISLGVLNLLPIPMLDGGHLFYYLIEIVKGSPVSEGIEIIGQKIGMTLLFGLMSIAIYNDLLRLVE